jgi:uncharacterized NAD(P)/FAD-binding protein YdhS
MRTGKPTLAIVGGGASGALVAAHVLRETSSPARVVLVERSGKVGDGIAFASGPQCHLLNVTARSMSAFEDDPDHFVRWLSTQGVPDAADSFVPRALYGRYLRDALWPRGQDRSTDVPVETVHGQVVDIETSTEGYRLVMETGRCLVASAVVLATGVVMRGLPSRLTGAAKYDRCIVNPWTAGALASIEPSATVVLLGSGLTAVDVLLALRESGHRGAVHAVSRHGLLPRAHRAQAQGNEALARLCRDLAGTQVRALLRRARQIMGTAAAEGADWRDMVDALRPLAPSLWSGLSAEEQRRFRRHLERLWSIHRHRMAPQVGQAVDELLDSGIFHVHAGEVVSASDADGALRLGVKLPLRERPYTWTADWLVNCTGTDPQLFDNGQPLMDALRARGLARPGPLNMGVATDDRGRALNNGGRPLGWLWAIGSLRQGQLLESTAVPEIRAQARRAAHDIERFLSNGPLVGGGTKCAGQIAAAREGAAGVSLVESVA